MSVGCRMSGQNSGNAKSYCMVRDRNSVGGRGDIGGRGNSGDRGEIGGRGDVRRRSSMEGGRPGSKATAALRRPPGRPSQSKVRKLALVVILTVVIGVG